MNWREMALLRMASLTRRVNPKGTDRLLRLLHNPDHRRWSIDTIVTTRDGTRFFADTASFMEWRLFFYASYEHRVQGLIRRLVRPGSVVIDVGANIGTHTLEMARAVGGGTVIACEPNPFVFDRLMQNLDLNGVKNVTACAVAMADRPGRISLYIPSLGDADQATARMGPATTQTRLSSTLRVNAQAVTVDADTIDDLAKRQALEDISLIKIDVEGYESVVLAGAQSVLATSHPALIFEYDAELWGAAGYHIGELLSRLRALGYDQFGRVAGDRSKYATIGSSTDIGQSANVVALTSTPVS